MGEDAIRSRERYICLRMVTSLGSEWYLVDFENLNKKNLSNVVKEEGILYPFLSLPDCYFPSSCASIGNDFYSVGGYRRFPEPRYLDFPYTYDGFCRCETFRRRQWKSDSAFVASLSKFNDFVEPSFDHSSADGNVEPTEPEGDTVDDDESSEPEGDTEVVDPMDENFMYGHQPGNMAAKFDASKPNEGFVEISPLLHPRAHAKALAFKGKIYVFGGEDSEGEALGECFDPELNTWTAISPPTEKTLYSESSDTSTTVSSLSFYFPVAIPYDEIQLLVGPFSLEDGKHVYGLYNVDSQFWTPYTHNSSSSYLDLRSHTYYIPVKVDNTLYYRRAMDSFSCGIIFSLDLECGLHRGSISSGLVDQREPTTDDYDLTNLFHLGGDEFCFFRILSPGCGHVSCECGSKFSILFTKVRVVRVGEVGGRALKVTRVSELSIPVPNHHPAIIEATPVDEIFVKTLQDIEMPDIGTLDIENADGTCVLAANVVLWASGIVLVGLLTLMVGTITISHVVRTGS